MSVQQDTTSGSLDGSPQEESVTVWFTPDELVAVHDYLYGRPADPAHLAAATERMEAAQEDDR